MDNLIKIFTVITARLVLLVLSLAVLVPVSVKVDDYRSAIAEAVQSRTGRNFQIRDGFSIDALPCCSLVLEGVRLGNPPGFEDDDFFTIEEIRIYPRVWPVITHRETVISDIVLRGLRINAKRDTNGTVNWQLSHSRKSAMEIPAISQETNSANESPQSIRPSSSPREQRCPLKASVLTQEPYRA